MLNSTAQPQSRKETPPPLACPCGGKEMVLVRVNPPLGALPELRTYRCGQCGAVETIEVRRPMPATG